MSGELFIDTNILVYSVSDNENKRTIAQQLLVSNRVAISPQIVGEFVTVTLKKNILPKIKVMEYARTFLKIFMVLPLTVNTVAQALTIMTKYKYSYWDSLIMGWFTVM